MKQIHMLPISVAFLPFEITLPDGRPTWVLEGEPARPPCAGAVPSTAGCTVGSWLTSGERAGAGKTDLAVGASQPGLWAAGSAGLLFSCESFSFSLTAGRLQFSDRSWRECTAQSLCFRSRPPSRSGTKACRGGEPDRRPSRDVSEFSERSKAPPWRSLASARPRPSTFSE